MHSSYIYIIDHYCVSAMCKVSAVCRTLFHLNTHCRRAVFSLLDKKDVHLAGLFCPVFLLWGNIGKCQYNIHGVSGGIVNILGGGSMDFSE